MSVFKLLVWVVKEIGMIIRDFLWKGLELGSKGILLVAWKRICRPRNIGGWGILNISEFNKALLEKWWWKIYSGQNGCWSKIIHFNYLNRGPPGPLFHTPPKNKSFFWASIILILPSFRFCTLNILKSNDSTLFWYDNLLEGRAPKGLWLDLFNDCIFP